MKIDTDRHEDLLIFLEENMSQLVKLKVASRAHYKNYDECYVNYLTAESCDDDERMLLYGEMVEDCHAAIQRKLETALNAQPELLTHQVVKEFVKLMN